MITFNWTINSTLKIINLNGLLNVIQNVNWQYTGTDENGASKTIYGVTPLNAPNPENFTPYDEITEANIIVWLENILNIAAMQKNIEQQIYLYNNSTTIDPLNS